MNLVAVMRPKLPEAEKIYPHLQRIDTSRIYSNFGPLNTELEERFSNYYGSASRVATTVSNATIALTVALNALAPERGALCAMPAWTFIASAHAALMAGLVPYFIDVDRKTWALDPQATAEAIAKAPGPVAAVMPVSPFGLPLDLAGWEAFREKTGVPVVIDAAAGFDTARPSAIPTVVSLHATKALGIGEGALILSTDSAFIREIRARSNFGFDASRVARMPAANAKLNEYLAAVGLAAMDEWPLARAEWMKAAQRYRKALGPSQMRLQAGFGVNWVGSACVLEFASGEAASRAEAALTAAGVETRRWWGPGAHRHPATAGLPTAPLVNTEHLAGATLAVPFYRDLSQDIVDRVAKVLIDIDEPALASA